MSLRSIFSRNAGTPDVRRGRGIPLPSLGYILLTCVIVGLGWILRDAFQRQSDAARPLISAETNSTERMQAFEELVGQGPSATPELVALLSHSDPNVKRLALYGLGRLKQSSSMPAICDLLADPDPTIRRSALAAVKSVCEDRDQLFQIALTLAQDSDESLRGQAVQILEFYGAETIPGIAGLLDSHDPAVSCAAIGLLTGIDRLRRDPTEVNALLRGLLADGRPAVRLSAIESVAARGAVTIADVRGWLHDDDLRIVNAGYRSVWCLGADASALLPDFEDRLSKPNPEIPDQVRVLRACGIDAAPVAPAVERLLPELEAFARVEAIATLHVMGVETAHLEQLLVPLLSDPDSHVRVAAGHLLVGISPAAARRQVAALLRELETQRQTITAADLATLRGLGAQAEAAVPVLVRLLAHERSDVVREVLLTIRAIGAPVAPAVPVLQSLLLRTDYRVQQVGLVVLALGAIGPEARSAGPNLAFILDNPRELIQGTPLVASQWPERRFEIVWALAQIGDDSPAVLASLRRQLQIPEEIPLALPSDTAAHRLLVIKTLARITGNSDNLLNDVLAFLEHDASSVRMHAALSINGVPGDRSPAVAPLTAALFDPDRYVRTAAALALEAIGPPAAEAKPELAEALRDTRNSVPNSFLRRTRPANPNTLPRTAHLADLSVSIAIRRALQAISGPNEGDYRDPK